MRKIKINDLNFLFIFFFSFPHSFVEFRKNDPKTTKHTNQPMNSFLFDVDDVYCKNGNMYFLLDTTSYWYDKRLSKLDDEVYYIGKEYSLTRGKERYTIIETNILVEEYHELEHNKIKSLLKMEEERMWVKWENNKKSMRNEPFYDAK